MGNAQVKDTFSDTRSLTLETALRLFTAKGYFNTSMQDIRKEANVSIGSIYHHFNSKEELAGSLYTDLVQRMEALIQDVLAEYGTAHDRIRAVVAALFQMADSEPDAVRFLLCAKHREFLPCEKPVCSSRPFEMMREMVQMGIDRGEICDLDPVVATTALFGGPIRLIQLKLDGALEGSLWQYFDEMWACSWSAVT